MATQSDMSTHLRELVREVLREVVPQKGATLAAIEAVKLASDHDLQAFVQRLMESAVQERVKAGKLKFTLGAVPIMHNAAAAMSGVVTEKAVDRLAAGGTLVLAADAVLTPLARDRLRKLGLKVERRR